jgi:CRISPR-associated protein Csh2
MESNTIVTTMNDDNSTFGKDYRIHYSLLAFNGTINKNAAKTTGLTEKDVDTFRDALWQSIPASPTRSKLNQYPKLYVEIIYNEGQTNGQFGDLRNLLQSTSKDGIKDKQVRRFSDLVLDTEPLRKLIKENKGKIIKDVVVRTSPDIAFNI